MVWQSLPTQASHTQSSPVPVGPVVPLFAQPSISPDRKEVAFVSGGDIWTVPLEGGEARLLVAHPANETRPLYSPDGKQLAFTSSRTGNGDVFVLSLATGEVKRLTFDDAVESVENWSADSEWLYFSSNGRDIAAMNDIFRVRASGGTPIEVTGEPYTNEFFAAPAPDGKRLAFNARGIASTQWWRHGHSHIDESEIWTMQVEGPPDYQQLTNRGAKDIWPMWGQQGSLYFVSDRDGAENIWCRAAGGEVKRVTGFQDGRVLWPTVTPDGSLIVFERNFQVWTCATATGQTKPIPITRRGAATVETVEHRRFFGQIQEFALAPDGKKVAFVVHGEVFAAGTKEDAETARVTFTPGREFHVCWAPDSQRIVYVSDRDGTFNLYSYDFVKGQETRLTSAANRIGPVFSPDGKWLACERNSQELCVLNLETKEEKVVAKAVFEFAPFRDDRPLVWSPDSQWIAFLAPAEKLFRAVYVVPLEGGTAQQVSFLSNSETNTLTWHPGGTYLLYNSNQRTENRQLARIDLTPRLPKFREDQFADLFKKDSQPNSELAKSDEKKDEGEKGKGEPRKPLEPVKIELANIRQRLSLVPVGVDVAAQTVSPDGKMLAVVGSVSGQANLYTFPLDELSREPQVAKQITSTTGFKSNLQFSTDGKEVWYLESGRINVIPVEGGRGRSLNPSPEMDVDFNREKFAVFEQAWSYLDHAFYDPNFHGVDWKAKRVEYLPRIAGAQTPDEMRRATLLMIGELNASHLGISGPDTSVTVAGRLGLKFDRTAFEQNGQLLITEVLPFGPAAVSGQIRVGYTISAIDGIPVGKTTNLEERLAYKIGRRVKLTIWPFSTLREGGMVGKTFEVAVQPISQTTEKGLRYRAWVEANRAYVAKISNGRLGYVHMVNMSSEALNQLYVDLDIENHGREGVVIDIRNNNGGFVNAYAIDVFARRAYLHMTQRGVGTAPARSQLGQRALEKPTILVTNQHSLSDAEDFTEGYRTLKLGKVVGEKTAGWIIFTWNFGLLDGSALRIPAQKITTLDGTNMELNPRPVDVPVSRQLGETPAGKDTQLETAVRELLRKE